MKKVQRSLFSSAQIHRKTAGIPAVTQKAPAENQEKGQKLH
jgi:hypothetical protein